MLRVKWHCYVFVNSHGLNSVSWIHDKYPCLYTAQLTSHRNQICLFICKLKKSFNLLPSKGNLSMMVLNKKIFAWHFGLSASISIISIYGKGTRRSVKISCREV